MTDIEKLTRELIALPSVNPAFLPENDPLASEARVADFLAATAAKAGLDIEMQEVVPGRCNVIARLSPSGPVKQRVVLGPHTDTVAAFTPEQLVPVMRDGRIHGRGACDTKGSVASMLGAVMEFAKKNSRPAQTEIIFCAFIDEEKAQAGSRFLAASGFKADLAIVGEPTKLKVVSAHKGSLWLRMETRGKAAHGACPDRGVNAVHEMARIVDLMQTEYAAMLAKRHHPLLGAPTISVGWMRGGSQANIVPAKCEACADRRTLPGENEETVKRELQALFRKHKLRAIIHDEKDAPCNPMETSADRPLVQQFLKAARQKAPVGVHYFCDAAVLAEAGTPSIVFGPGDVAQAHTADEWVSVKSLNDAAACLVQFLQSLP